MVYSNSTWKSSLLFLAQSCFSRDRHQILTEKAVPQESTWPASASEADEENSEAAARWRKLRNVVRAVAAFRFFGKNGGLMVAVKAGGGRATGALAGGVDGDALSQASSSEDNAARPKREGEDLGGAASKATKAEDDQGEEVEVTQQQFKEQFRDGALHFSSLQLINLPN